MKLFKIIITIIVIIFLLAKPSFANELSIPVPEPVWVKKVDKFWYIDPKLAVDSLGNETIITHVGVDKRYIVGTNAKTGEKRWSILVKNKRAVKFSEDGYIFLYTYEHSRKKTDYVTVISPSTGKEIYSQSLPTYWKDIYPRERGSFYTSTYDYLNKESSIYYYNKAGKFVKKSTITHQIYDIIGDYFFAFSSNFNNKTIVYNLKDGKKIVTLTDGTREYDRRLDRFVEFYVLSGGTIIQPNVRNDKFILRAYSSSGKLKWTKYLPYTQRTELATLGNNFIVYGGDDNKISLFNEAGSLLGTKTVDFWGIIFSQDSKSFMISSKNEQDEYSAYLLDTKSLKTLFHTNEEIEVVQPLDIFAFLFNTSELYVYRTAKYNLSKIILGK